MWTHQPLLDGYYWLFGSREDDSPDYASGKIVEVVNGAVYVLLYCRPHKTYSFSMWWFYGPLKMPSKELA